MLRWNLFIQKHNNIFYQDINLTDPVGVVDPSYNLGFDKRIAYASSSLARRKNPNITNAILISNTNEGFTYNLGLTLSKSFKNFFARLLIISIVHRM